MTPIVFIDTETTGLDPRAHHVWEIGAIRRDPDGYETEFVWQISTPLVAADPKSLEICRYHERFEVPDGTDAIRLMGDGMPPWKLTRHEMHFDFQEVVDGAHLVGAVPSFDDAFLKAMLQAHGRRVGWHYHLIDVEALAVGYLNGVAARAVDEAKMRGEAPPPLDRSKAAPPWNSGDLSRAVGIDPERFDRHTALGDAKWARAIYDAITGGPRA